MRSVSLFAFALVAVAGAASADSPPAPEAAEALHAIMAGNGQFVTTHNAAHFATFRDEQHPFATVVACSDSRFQTNAIDDHAEGELFVVRNIGNQVDQSAGSIEYGVRHLHTPLLLIVGHVRCGAVKAALGDYSEEDASIRHELDGLHLGLTKAATSASPEARWQSGVAENVNQQVKNAMQLFREEIRAGHLTVVGAVYDFRNELHAGDGRLVIINVNGETNEKKLAEAPVLKAARNQH